MSPPVRTSHSVLVLSGVDIWDALGKRTLQAGCQSTVLRAQNASAERVMPEVILGCVSLLRRHQPCLGVAGTPQA